MWVAWNFFVVVVVVVVVSPTPTPDNDDNYGATADLLLVVEIVVVVWVMNEIFTSNFHILVVLLIFDDNWGQYWYWWWKYGDCDCYCYYRWETMNWMDQNHDVVSTTLLLQLHLFFVKKDFFVIFLKAITFHIHSISISINTNIGMNRKKVGWNCGQTIGWWSYLGYSPSMTLKYASNHCRVVHHNKKKK